MGKNDGGFEGIGALLHSVIPSLLGGQGHQNTGLGQPLWGSGGQGTPSKKTAPAPAPVPATPPESPLIKLLTQPQDPLGMQLLWANSIQPYLQQLHSQGVAQSDQYGAQMKQALGNQMPAYAKQIMSSQVPEMQAAMNNENNALAGAAATAPMWSQLLSSISGQQSAAQLMEAELAKTLVGTTSPGLIEQLTGGATGAGAITAGLSPTQQALIQSLSGVG